MCIDIDVYCVVFGGKVKFKYWLIVVELLYVDKCDYEC